MQLTTDNTSTLDTLEFNQKVITINTALVLTNTTIKTPMFAGIIPANSIDKNGYFEIIALIEASGSGTKLFEVLFNDTAITRRSVSTTALLNERWLIYIFNRGVTNTQIKSTMLTGELFTTLNIDTTKDINVKINIQNSSTAGISKIHIFNVTKN